MNIIQDHILEMNGYLLGECTWNNTPMKYVKKNQYKTETLIGVTHLDSC